MSSPAVTGVETTAAAVEAEGLRRVFGHVAALDDVNVTVREGEFFSLLGPSGCGKTTLLRVIAGLEVPDAGELRLHGAPALGVPAHRRSVNTVFQSYALFPHLTVWDNVAFGLRMRRLGRAEIKRRVRDALALVQIPALAERFPLQLSGGQKQRVALARALVNGPQVLLLDEPLAALDMQLRQQLREELRRIQRRTGVTFLLVTHDQEEALAVSDRIAVMRAGRIEQVGTGPELYARPRTRFVAEFLGACNLVVGSVLEAGADGWTFGSSFGRVLVSGDVPASGLESGAPVTIGIRPENLEVRSGWLPDSSGTGPWLRGRLRECIYTGAATELVVDLGDQTLRARRVNVAGAPVSWGGGEAVEVRMPPDAVILLED
jgi:spermidine/putrescine transport system ATP-binding protein